MNIIYDFLNINPYSRTCEKQGKIEYIVVHYVGNPNTSAKANRNYFNNLAKTHATYASSQYIIGLNGEILHCIPDNEVAFHAGSHTMNRKSIGIECCHPDNSGKFNSATYNSLLDLCYYLCKKYNIDTEHVIRHYDVTGKLCPKYYVQNPIEWIKFKQELKIKLDEGGDEMRIYQNGSTPEPVYSDTDCTKKIGSLDVRERCDCYGIFMNRAVVRYHVNGTNNYKVGFCKWLGGVQ